MFKTFIKQLYSYFLSFVSEKPKEKKISSPNNKFLFSINFELGFDNTINIVCFWPNLDEFDEETIVKLSEQYAKLIYLIDNGAMKKDIVDTLYDVHNSQNPYDIFFIQEVLSKWVDLVKKNKDSFSKPMIRPINTFRMYQN